MKRDILITGHPRSGTKYVAELFDWNGINIYHERVGKKGTCNWQMLVKDFDYPFIWDYFVRQDIKFKYHFHIYRNPLECISSIALTERRSEWYREKFVNLYGNDFEKAVLSLSGWNKIARSQMAMPIILERTKELFGFTELIEIQNEREHDKLTERELQCLVSNDIWQIYLKEKEIYSQLNNTLDDNYYCHFIESI
jgi:hypothetical protein